MWKWPRKRRRPGTRELLLEMIPKVVLDPVVVPPKYKIPKNWKPPESRTLTMAAKKAASGAGAGKASPKSPSGKKPSGNKSGKVSPEAKKLTEKYEVELSALDEQEASKLINNA